ncbi:M15 family metallopeptidase [Nocardioides immobilis]|nr:M15 family metallopeptidase [Nocardioides immobilis]
MGDLQRRARLATVVGLALLGAACSISSDPQSDLDPTNAAAFGEVDPAAQDRLTVDPPGKLDEAQAGDDLLIVGPDSLPGELVDRILGVKVDGRRGVAASELFSLGEFTLENRVFRLAAVDPAGFRRFAGHKSATFQAQWDRIAGGEIAVLDTAARRLPIDDDDNLLVGSGDQRRAIHVGAFSPGQVGTIDAVVNTAWGEELGLPADNALVISTGLVSPQAVRERIRAIDPDLSITALDIVEATGIEPGVVQNVSFVGTFADAVGSFSYTPIGGGRVAPDPAWVRSHIVTEAVPILGRVTCNRYLMPQLRAALAEIQSRGLADEINPGEYAGCYYPRFIAGSTTLSNHTFGLALDLNVPGNLRGTRGEIDRTVVAIFKRWGFAWGGDWSYTDPMHFELDRIVTPG